VGGVLGALAQAGGAVAGGAASGPLGSAGAAMSMLGSARNYYRGTLRRVESGPITVSVVINSVRTSLPAIHAAGTFVFGSQPPQHVEFWWLDNPAYPLTLKWLYGHADSLVTRIDFPLESNAAPSDQGNAGNLGSAGSGLAKLSAQLDKSCHAEMSGIYFNTGSAQILDESRPTWLLWPSSSRIQFAVLLLRGTPTT
jgi:hypothetical protein